MNCWYLQCAIKFVLSNRLRSSVIVYARSSHTTVVTALGVVLSIYPFKRCHKTALRVHREYRPGPGLRQESEREIVEQSRAPKAPFPRSSSTRKVVDPNALQTALA